MKYPIGIQNFESLRREGYAYVDKTALVWQMANTGRYYFLSRPRRFGKSLLLSTLEAYLEGKRELFQGLAIEKLETAWERHPILHLDLNASRYTCLEDLYEIIDRYLRSWEDQYGRDERTTSLAGRFADVIKRAYEKTGMTVAILVDEYDKPLTSTITDEALQDKFRIELKAFYGVMKSTDRYIKVGFLTGVTKFSKVSVFSDLNNIDDISMDNRYITACGMTEQEIRVNFDEDVAALAEANSMTKDECYAKMKCWYDGYHFNENSVGMYNPYSVIKTLSKLRFGDYWVETGTPTLLVNLLKQSHFDLNRLVDGEVSGQLLNSVDAVKENPLSIIYQSGYLTIKGYDQEFDEYTLGFPNEEVERGFVSFLLPMYSNQDKETAKFNIAQFVKEIRSGKPEAFMTRLEAMMADTDYRIIGDSELYFHNFLFIFFRLLGLYVEVERTTSDGRMDMVVKTPNYVYILEFKLDQSADIALQQIEDKQYAKPFEGDGRTIYKIGVNFSSETRRMTEWKIA